MKTAGIKNLIIGTFSVILFIIWTILIQEVDVQPIGVNGTSIGFATINSWFHSITGVNMTLYNITDWLGLLPIFICFGFGLLGLIQLIKRKSIFKVDFSLIVLGIYYVIVVILYLAFESIPINYRPILINGFMEASYPSSTTLLVLAVMPSFNFQIKNRINNQNIKRLLCFISVLFSMFMVVGRIFSGVHWITDILGSVLLSTGLYFIYKAIILIKNS